jgi:hypothetical protein
VRILTADAFEDARFIKMQNVDGAIDVFEGFAVLCL